MAQKDIVVNLRLQKDESSSLVIKNLSDQIKSVGKAFNTIERDVGKTSTRITELNTTLKDAKKSIADLVGKSGSTSEHLKAFNKQMMSLRELAKMMGEALRTSRKSVENLGTSTVTAAAKVSTSEANMTAAVAKGTATRNALRAKESSGWITQTTKPIGSYVKPSSSQLSASSDAAIISMREELKKTIPIWEQAAIANARWSQGVSVASRNYVDWVKKSTVANVDWKNGVKIASSNFAEWEKTTKGATTAHKGFWSSLKDTANGLASVNTHTEGAMAKTAFLVTKVLKLMAAYMAFRFALQMVSQEMKAAFTVTEDYTRSVVEMAALMTTFAVPKPGEDPSETYQRSYEYAKKLVIELEKLDMQTIANAQDLKTMAQAFIMNGVQINVQNKQAMEGFRNLANALKILVGNFPNQQAQISQEIRAMLLGTAKASDTLSKVMKAKLGSGWADIMKKWRAEGPDEFIIKIGQALKGFELATKDIEGLWETLASSLKTIHDIIFRMAFKGLHDDIIGGLQGVVLALRDAEGNLTPLARNIGKALVESWLFFKDIVKDVYIFLTPILWAMKTIVKFLWEIKALAPIIIGLFSIWLLKVMGIAAVLRLMTGTSAVAFTALTAAIGTATTATGRLVAMFAVLKASWLLLAIGAITTAILMMKNAVDKTARSVTELAQQYKFLTMAELKNKQIEQKVKILDLGGKITNKPQDWMSSVPLKIEEITKKWQELNTKEIEAGTIGAAQFAEKYKDEQNYLSLLITENKTKKDIADLDKKIFGEGKDPKKTAQTKIDMKSREDLIKDLKNSKTMRESISIKTKVEFPTIMKKGGILDKLSSIPGSAGEAFKNLNIKEQTEAANEFLAVSGVMLETLKELALVPAPDLAKPMGDTTDAMKKQFDVLKNELENIKSKYKDKSQEIVDSFDAEEKALKARVETGGILESEALIISLDMIERKKTALLSALGIEGIAIKHLYEQLSKYAVVKKIPEAEKEKIASDVDAYNEDKKRREAKATSEAVVDAGKKEADEIVRISKLKLQQADFDKQYAENRIQYANQVGQIEEEYEKKRVEFMKEIGEMGAGEYYEKQLGFIEQTKDRELKVLEETESAWKDYFIQKMKFSIDTEETRQALQNESKEQFVKSEEDKLKIVTTANNARLEMLRTMGRDIEKIYGEQGDAGVMLRALDDLDKEWRKKWDDIYKFTQDTFKGIADSGSNLMFDVLTGKLDTFGNYFKDVWNKILRYITDETSKTFTKLFEDQFRKLMTPDFSQIAYPAGGAQGSGNMAITPTNGIAEQLNDSLGYCSDSIEDSTKMLDKNTKGLDKVTIAMTLVAAAIAVFQMASQAINDPNSVKAGSFGMSGLTVGGLLGAAGMAALGFSLVGGLITAGVGLVAGLLIGGLIDMFNKVKKISMKVKYDFSNLSWDVSEKTFGLPDKVATLMKRTLKTFQDQLLSVAIDMGAATSKFYEDWSGTQNSGDMDKALGRIMRKYILFALNIDVKDFKRQGEDLQETVNRIVVALKGLTRLQDTLGITIEQIGKVDDAVLDWNIKMSGLTKDIQEYKNAFANMFDIAVDPSEINTMAQNLYNALIEKYDLEKQMVQDIVDEIETARENFASFMTDVSEKIYELGTGENIGRYTSGTGLENSPEYLNYLKETMDDLKQTTIDMSNATDSFTSEEIVTGFENAKDAIDTWYETMTTAITDYYESQTDAIQDSIDLLEDEKDANSDLIDILQDQADAIEDWKSVLDSVNDMIWDMKTTTTSPRDSRERLAYALGGVLEARTAFQTATATGTEAEKVAAAEDYNTMLSDYLEVAQEAYTRPSSEYQAIYNQIITWLGEIASYVEPKTEGLPELLREIADLEARNEIIQTSIDVKNKEIAALNVLMEEDLDALKVDAEGYYKWVKEYGAEAYGTYIDSLEQQLKDIIGTGTVQEYFINLRDTLVLALQDLRDKLKIYFDGLTNPEMTSKQANTELKRLQNMEKLATKISVLETKPSTPANLTKLEELRADLAKLKDAAPSQTGASYFVPMIALIEKQLEKLKEGSDKYLSLKNILDILQTGVIPKFASGAFVRKPTLALIGEHGPEYVTPQRQMMDMTNRIKSFDSGEGNIVFSPNFVINTTGEVDEKHLAEIIQDRMLISLRRGKGKQIVRKLF